MEINMLTISTRVEEETKENAERIANSIGLTLSAVINVFLKRFVIENGSLLIFGPHL